MKQAEQRFSTYVTDRLLRAGWYAGREVNTEIDAWWADLDTEGFATHLPARVILDEFGGLMIGVEDAGSEGEECARSEVCVDPRLCSGYAEIFRSFARFTLGALAPLGDVISHHLMVAADSSGKIYELTQHKILLLGNTFEEALERRLRGRQSIAVVAETRPLRVGQDPN